MAVDRSEKCHFCRSDSKKFLYSIHDRINDRGGDVFKLYECTCCGVISYLPVLSPEQLSARYPFDYAVKTCSTGGWGAPQLYRMYKYWSFRHCLQRPIRGLNVLDVGCGRGELLRSFRKKGARVFGIEINPSDVAHLRSCGISVFADSSEIIRMSDVRFDVVIASHVIEHFSDPEIELENINKVMKPNGRLLVVTPNARSLGRYLFGRYWYGHQVPHHVFVFNKRNLSRLLEKTGFDVLSVKDIVAPNVLQASTGDLFRFGGNGFTRRFIAPLFTLNNILFLALFYIPAAAGAFLGMSDIIIALARKPPDRRQR